MASEWASYSLIDRGSNVCFDSPEETSGRGGRQRLILSPCPNTSYIEIHISSLLYHSGTELMRAGGTDVDSSEIAQAPFDWTSGITSQCLYPRYPPRICSLSHQSKVPGVSLWPSRQRHYDLQPPCWRGGEVLLTKAEARAPCSERKLWILGTWRFSRYFPRRNWRWKERQQDQ